MTTADQLAIVSQTLFKDCSEVPTVLASAGLVKEWLKSDRLLVVIESRSDPGSGFSQALFIYQTQSSPIKHVRDLVLETVIPIDENFRCEIDSGQSAINFKVKCLSLQPLLFEMVAGFHTQNFIAEIFKLTDTTSTRKASSKALNWLNKYHKIASENGSKSSVPNSSDQFSSSLNDLRLNDSTEPKINRQEIAMGVTPIAARESAVSYFMTTRENEYTNIKYFNVFVATWNVNGRPPSGLLTEWLGADENPPDLYAIAFQELDLSKEAFVFAESPREEEWRRVVADSLHPKARYHQVKLVRLVGMMLIVYVNEDNASHISEICSDTAGTGIMGMLGNKGGVAVRLEFHNSSICFVNSHLAAHVSEYERRNQDYHEICSRITFQIQNTPTTIQNHDSVFWIGDLNYRITDLDVEKVKELIRENKLEELHKVDQLKQQMESQKVFIDYREGKLNFPPTYKFDPGTDNWDSSDKARAPAWTDRVLWKGQHITQTSYKCYSSLKISDHKPVSASFKAGMKVIDPVKYRKTYEEVMKKLDKLENEFLPQVTVIPTEIDFDKVVFMESVTRSLTVANNGQVPVKFEFIRKLADTSYCKPWLSVEPNSGYIKPGESLDLTLEICVGKTTAGTLNLGTDQLYDILVLHLVNGKDIFVTVTGTYQRSVFGASIEALCHLTVPIAELSAGAISDLEKQSSKKHMGDDTKVDPYPVPKELWFLCDLITSLGMHHEQLFAQSGLRSEIFAIRDWLDTGLPVDKPVVSAHSASEALLLFIESLREPVIPDALYTQCLENSGNYLACKQIISKLPLHHRYVFDYVTAFLREVLRFSAQNNMDSKILATLFGSALIRDPIGGGNSVKPKQIISDKKTKFIYHFIINDPD